MQRVLLMSLFLALMPLELYALSAEQKGLEIAREADQRDDGFGNHTAELTMVLRNAQGDEVVRRLDRKTLEVPGDGDRDLNVFLSPRDVAGTTVLTFAHALDPDDQWIYLPSLKRVKRISSANKSGPFMGSEFAFEDLSRPEVEKYTYRYLRDEVLDGHDCFVLEMQPAYENSGYTRLVEWVDKNTYRPRKVDYYDRKNTLLKTLNHLDYQQYLGRYWRPGKMVMENHQTGKTTILNWDNYLFQVELSDRDFDQAALRRVR